VGLASGYAQSTCSKPLGSTATIVLGAWHRVKGRLTRNLSEFRFLPWLPARPTRTFDLQALEESVIQEKSRAKKALEEEQTRAHELDCRLARQKVCSSKRQRQPEPESRPYNWEGSM
jgi:hypothetical protein